MNNFMFFIISIFIRYNHKFRKNIIDMNIKEPTHNPETGQNAFIK